MIHVTILTQHVGSRSVRVITPKGGDLIKKMQADGVRFFIGNGPALALDEFGYAETQDATVIRVQSEENLSETAMEKIIEKVEEILKNSFYDGKWGKITFEFSTFTLVER